MTTAWLTTSPLPDADVRQHDGQDHEAGGDGGEGPRRPPAGPPRLGRGGLHLGGLSLAHWAAVAG